MPILAVQASTSADNYLKTQAELKQHVEGRSQEKPGEFRARPGWLLIDSNNRTVTRYAVS